MTLPASSARSILAMSTAMHGTIVRLCCCTLCGGMAFCVVRTICHVVYPVMMHATMRVNLFFPSLRAGEALKPHTKPDPEKKTRVHPHRQSQFYGLGSIPKSSLSGFPSGLNRHLKSLKMTKMQAISCVTSHTLVRLKQIHDPDCRGS